MPRLVVLRGPGQGRAFDVGDEAGIGRLPANQVSLPGDKISRRHARILQEDGRYFICDLGSRNGIVVNGRPTQKAELNSGDRIEIGNTLLLFELDKSTDFPTQEVDTRPGEPAKLPSGEPVFFSEDASASAEHFEKSVSGDDEAEADDLDAAAASPAGDPLPKLREANRKLKALHDVSDAIHETFDLRELMHKVLNLVLDIFQAERAVILLYDESDGKLRPAAARNRQKTTAKLAVSQTVVDYVAAQKRSVISADALSDPRFDPSESIALQNINSVMCVPLTSKGKSQGVLYVDNRGQVRRYEQDHLRLLTIIARQAATAIDNARSYMELHREREVLKRQIGEKYAIIGQSERLKDVLEQVGQVAHGDTTVLICGETGAGKELIARAIHDASVRGNGPFTIVNCASIPESLLESELFGHEKGAFTGADRRRSGKFELADRGTLFLDEVGEVSLAIQTKFLRAVEEKEFDRVGGTRPVSVDVRIVAATNRDLAQMVREGTFRRDLYYRLDVVTIDVPPLRDRRDDIPLLADYFLNILAREMGRPVPKIGDGALELMTAYHWPGNIRELKNAMERAILLGGSGCIEIDDLPPSLIAGNGAPGANDLARGTRPPLFPLAPAVQDLERRAIREALALAKGVKSRAAELLGISRPTLDKKLREYGDL
ncbi:MAG: sigma 54-interacting transcriptional regulator [Planctomycetes bacterium]|nr:sigma 54-interacting transcriptional regulator [Planctomycetota bacterium]